MTYFSYIQRQKQLIRARHEGETYLFTQNTVIALRPTEQIFEEMDKLEGLNKNERKDFNPITRSPLISRSSHNIRIS
jgi:hypothetical protein